MACPARCLRAYYPCRILFKRMTYSRTKRKRVFIAGRTIFSSLGNTDLRKQKSTRTVVQQHRPGSERSDPDLIRILQSLLRDNIFRYRDNSNARCAFPELYKLWPTDLRTETVSMPKITQQSESQKRLLSSLEQYDDLLLRGSYNQLTSCILYISGDYSDLTITLPREVFSCAQGYLMFSVRIL